MRQEKKTGPSTEGTVNPLSSIIVSWESYNAIIVSSCQTTLLTKDTDNFKDSYKGSVSSIR